MPQLYLALALHNHQPVGNFDWVFREAHDHAYAPMVAALERHPGVRLALHYTGPVRDWLLANEPGLIERVRALAARGQVELLTGGYYEPVLASLPDADKHGQLRKLIEAVRADFGVEPTGAWLAERVWEPYLPKPLAEAGIEYTILDDTHFAHAGYDPAAICGYYVTEEQGRPLKIFATSRDLRYSIPWQPVETIIEWLRERAAEYAQRGWTTPPVLTMGDDGEKFGMWPGTYVPMWQEDGGWIERYFSALEANADWLATIPPGEFARRFPAQGRIYLPTTSYDEMTEWSLPAEIVGEIKPLREALKRERPEALRFIRGGFWRNFMVKYPEVNTLHKKALLVSAAVHRLPPGKVRDRALDLLWQGQGNCPYWHGVFGGIYLGNVRSQMFTSLIAAENLALPPRPEVTAEVADLDLDGSDEVLLRSAAFTLYVDPADGGSVYEWDWRPRAVNVANVLTRRFEGYHPELVAAARARRVQLSAEAFDSDMDPTPLHEEAVRVKEANLEAAIAYDWHRRTSLLDHFLGEGATLEGYAIARYPENGDFVNQGYGYTVEPGAVGALLHLYRDGHVWDGPEHRPVRVEKRLHLDPERAALRTAYRLVNPSDRPLVVRFGVESDWALLAGASPDAYCELNPADPGDVPAGGGLGVAASAATPRAMPPATGEAGHGAGPGRPGEGATPEAAELGQGAGKRGALNIAAEASEVRAVRLVDPHTDLAVTIRLGQPATLWRFPLETVSASEGGFERVLQGISVLPHWQLELPPNGSVDLELRFEVEPAGDTAAP